MNNKPLVRVNYVDPITGNQRDGNTANVESRIDQEQYLLPLEQLSGALHGWGIAAGLSVTAALGKPGLKVMPGVAVDANGHHISLANNGTVEVNPNAAAAGTSTLVTVPSNDGVVFDTTTPPPVVVNGAVLDQYLTIEWKEIPDTNPNTLRQGLFQILQTPWLRLVPLGNPAVTQNDGLHLILARVGMDPSGKVTSLTPEGRRQIGLSVGTLNFQQGQSVPPQLSVDNNQSVAAIGPRPAGGLTISADTVAFQTLAGSENLLLDVAGGQFGRSNGPTTFHLDGSQIADVGTGLTVTSANQITVTTAHLGIGVKPTGTGARGGDVQLDVAGRSRFRKGPTDDSAGTWFYQNGADHAFVGMQTDHQIGLFGADGVGWGLVMNTTQDGNVGIGTTSPGFRLDVADRMRVRNGKAGSAGIWFNENGADHAFVGMMNPTTLGLWGSDGAQWGLQMNTQNGSVTIDATKGGAGSATTGLSVTGISQAGCFTNTSNKNGVLLSSSTLAGFFGGNVQVSGTLSKSAGTFTIDHPLDPANKFLSHSFVESPDMMNVYTGITTTDENGEAIVELPAYFDALNKDLRYQLTPIGQLALAAVIEEVQNCHFKIKSDKPGVKISWTVTGVRQDAYANAHRVVVEEDKQDFERGHFIHPRLHGESISKYLWKAHVRKAGGAIPPEPEIESH